MPTPTFNDPASIISTGMVAALGPLALNGATIVVRKFPNAKEGDPALLVTVSMLGERFEPATVDDDYAYDGYWPVLITIIRKMPMLTADAGVVNDMRWKIRRTAMEFTLPSSGIVIDGPPGYEPHPQFDVGAADSNYDYSPQLFVYRTHEPRGAV